MFGCVGERSLERERERERERGGGDFLARFVIFSVLTKFVFTSSIIEFTLSARKTKKRARRIMKKIM